MIIPSEYIQIIAAGIYALALFYTVVTFRRTKKLDQITQMNIIMADLRNLDLELAKIPSEHEYDDTRSRWYSRTFNTLNWPSFLINEKVISDKRIIEHLKPILISYYEDIFMKYPSITKTDSGSYPDFKKLYQAFNRVAF
jgi:hypothetical protein